MRDAADGLWDRLIDSFGEETRQVWIDEHAASSDGWQSCSRDFSTSNKSSATRLSLGPGLGRIEAEALHEMMMPFVMVRWDYRRADALKARQNH